MHLNISYPLIFCPYISSTHQPAYYEYGKFPCSTLANNVVTWNSDSSLVLGLVQVLYDADQIRICGLAVPILTEVFTCERAAYASTIGKMPGYGTVPVCTAVLFRQKNSRYRKFRLSPKWAGKLGFSPKLRPLWRAATSQHACGFMQDSVIFWCLVSDFPTSCKLLRVLQNWNCTAWINCIFDLYENSYKWRTCYLVCPIQ